MVFSENPPTSIQTHRLVSKYTFVWWQNHLHFSGINCPNLMDPTNGMVSFSATTSGSSATYTCNTGYQLDGASTRTCQSDGTWSGSAPTCTRMYTNKINTKLLIINHCQNYVIHSRFFSATWTFLNYINQLFQTTSRSHSCSVIFQHHQCRL